MCNRLSEIMKNGDAGIFPVYYSLKHNIENTKHCCSPFSYRNRKPLLHDFFLLRFVKKKMLRFVKWVLRHINIGSSTPDWPGTVQKHADTFTALKEQVDRLIGRRRRFCLKIQFGINNLRCETAAVHIATSSKRKSA